VNTIENKVAARLQLKLDTLNKVAKSQPQYVAIGWDSRSNTFAIGFHSLLKNWQMIEFECLPSWEIGQLLGGN
jgi:hypothetical protein